jgi:hypothetical protein
MNFLLLIEDRAMMKNYAMQRTSSGIDTIRVNVGWLDPQPIAAVDRGRPIAGQKRQLAANVNLFKIPLFLMDNYPQPFACQASISPLS